MFSRITVNEALQALEADDEKCPSNLFVDFDHTLLRQNSTSLFLSSARPKIFVKLIKAILIIFILRFYSSRENRQLERMHVFFVAALLPWNLWLWRWQAATFAKRHMSHEFVQLLLKRDPAKTVVLSAGYSLIIRPMIANNLPNIQLLATKINPLLKIPYKLDMLRDAGYSDPQIQSAAFITDSLDDSDLLKACRLPILIEPLHDAITESSTYIPLWYTFRVKFDYRHARSQILFMDIPIILFPLLPFRSVSALVESVMLLFSLYAIYEIGYWENDTKGRLSESRAAIYDGRLDSRAAWGFALAAAAGSLITMSDRPVHDMLTWVGVLIILRVLYTIYNSRTPWCRVLLYPLLQLIKYFSIYLVIYPSTILLIFPAAQILYMSHKYSIYRSGGKVDLLQLETLRMVLIIAQLSVGMLVLRESADITVYTVLLLGLVWLNIKLYRRRCTEARAAH